MTNVRLVAVAAFLLILGLLVLGGQRLGFWDGQQQAGDRLPSSVTADEAVAPRGPAQPPAANSVPPSRIDPSAGEIQPGAPTALGGSPRVPESATPTAPSGDPAAPAGPRDAASPQDAGRPSEARAVPADPSQGPVRDPGASDRPATVPDPDRPVVPAPETGAPARPEGGRLEGMFDGGASPIPPRPAETPEATRAVPPGAEPMVSPRGRPQE